MAKLFFHSLLWSIESPSKYLRKLTNTTRSVLTEALYTEFYEWKRKCREWGWGRLGIRICDHYVLALGVTYVKHAQMADAVLLRHFWLSILILNMKVLFGCLVSPIFCRISMKNRKNIAIFLCLWRIFIFGVKKKAFKCVPIREGGLHNQAQKCFPATSGMTKRQTK